MDNKSIDEQVYQLTVNNLKDLLEREEINSYTYNRSLEILSWYSVEHNRSDLFEYFERYSYTLSFPFLREFSSAIGTVCGGRFSEDLLEDTVKSYYDTLPKRGEPSADNICMNIIDSLRSNMLIILNSYQASNTNTDMDYIIDKITTMIGDLYDTEYPYQYEFNVINSYVDLFSKEVRNLIKFYLIKNTSREVLKVFLSDYREILDAYNGASESLNESKGLKIYELILVCGSDDYINLHMDQLPKEKQYAWMEFMLGI